MGSQICQNLSSHVETVARRLASLHLRASYPPTLWASRSTSTPWLWTARALPPRVGRGPAPRHWESLGATPRPHRALLQDKQKPPRTDPEKNPSRPFWICKGRAVPAQTPGPAGEPRPGAAGEAHSKMARTWLSSAGGAAQLRFQGSPSAAAQPPEPAALEGGPSAPPAVGASA